MIPVIVAAIVTIIAGWLLIKRYQTQMVLLVAGLVIIYVAVLCGVDAIMPKGAKATGFIGFDPIALIGVIAKKQLTSVGLIIMVSGGFAGYMSQIGASNALVKLVAEPLKKSAAPTFSWHSPMSSVNALTSLLFLPPAWSCCCWSVSIRSF